MNYLCVLVFFICIYTIFVVLVVSNHFIFFITFNYYFRCRKSVYVFVDKTSIYDFSCHLMFISCNMCINDLFTMENWCCNFTDKPKCNFIMQKAIFIIVTNYIYKFHLFTTFGFICKDGEKILVHVVPFEKSGF